MTKKRICDYSDCNQKIRIGQLVECKCSLFFCLKHKYPDEHFCLYDRKKEWIEKIKKENPKMKTEKVPKI